MDESTQKPTFVHLTLSAEQQAQVRQLTGRDSQALRLTVDELERRIVPALTSNANESLMVEPLEERIAPGFTENHNESLLDD